MNNKYTNYFTTQITPAFVLEHHTPDDVARAIIQSGKQKQPFYIFNMDEAYRRIQHFKDLMPRVKLFYAMKANDTDKMLQLAVALGLGFDCASPGEIYRIRQLKVDPKSIIFAMPCKSSEEMEYARKSGIRHTTFDSSYELKKIRQWWPDARLLIRIRIDGKAKQRLGLKFGCDFETEAIDLLDEAAGLGLNILQHRGLKHYPYTKNCKERKFVYKVAGVAFHVGSICYSLESYVLGLRQARALFDHEEKAGRHMNIVDIGGGFISDRTDNIDEVSPLINDTLEELFPDPSVQVIAEPGRYLSDSAFKMFCSVIGIRQVIRNNVPVNMIYINNGKHGTMKFDESWRKIRKYQGLTEIGPDVDEEIIIWGPTCNPNDRVMQDYGVQLPRCAPGDWLTVDIHGAYTITFSTRFSCIEAPLIRSVVSKNLWNDLKTSSVFAPSDFVLNPDISIPLPSTIPPVLLTDEIDEHLETPTLNVLCS